MQLNADFFTPLSKARHPHLIGWLIGFTAICEMLARLFSLKLSYYRTITCLLLLKVCVLSFTAD